MTIVSRRLVPFAAVIAVALTLAVWITASAGGWPQNSSPLPTMHFKAVPTSTHYSLNGATDKKPVGATLQETVNFISSGKQIGRGFIAGTIVNNAGLASSTSRLGSRTGAASSCRACGAPGTTTRQRSLAVPASSPRPAVGPSVTTKT
jgi:hypothetical protein